MEEVLDLGLSELLDDGSVTVIEWGDVIAPLLPQDYLEIRMHIGEGDDDRVIELEPVGQRWSARMRALHHALAPWIDEAG
jgi:tRNA threonylcarbamoyladenosine biosynthesis protein TsaE